MAPTVWITIDKWMRSLHICTGLFLAPWMIIYAISAFYLNHYAPITNDFETVHPPYGFVVAKSFKPNDDFFNPRDERAKIILDYVDMNGPFRIGTAADPLHFTIDRPSASGSHRVTYHPQDYRIRIEKQEHTALIDLINFLHYRNGYDYASITYTIWAVIVDLTAFSMILWTLSGIYLWTGQRHKRFKGAITLLAGLALFAVLVVTMLN